MPKVTVYLDAKGVSELFSMPRSTIYDLTHRGHLPHFKIGRSIRFKQSEVIGWMEKHKVNGSAPKVKALYPL